MLAIVDYKAGNLTSVALAMAEIGQECVITDDPKAVLKAERVLFPGVGAAGTAMNNLKTLRLDTAMREVFAAGTPVMGICLGTQIILSFSEEQNTACLGLVPGKTLRFATDMTGADGHKLKIPHMGWNQLKITQPHFILKDVDVRDEFYFVHSYYPQPDNAAMVLATSDYGIEFPAAIGLKNLFATQFHPEKSGRVGLTLLNNFCKWTP